MTAMVKKASKQPRLDSTPKLHCLLPIKESIRENSTERTRHNVGNVMCSSQSQTPVNEYLTYALENRSSGH